MSRRKVVSVVGNAQATRQGEELAEELGCAIVEQGFRVLTGGLGGVMEAASRGARAAARYREGDIIGILPTGDVSDANRYVDIVIPTAMGYARNTLVVGSADAVVAVGGGAGTLTEMAMAWQLGKVVIGLAVPGWSERLAGTPIDSRRGDVVLRAENVAAAIDHLRSALGQVDERPA